jgi:hypothetical protein
MEVPCKDCLLISLCRNKWFHTLMSDCDIVYNYAFRIKEFSSCGPHSEQIKKVSLIKDILNPSKWDVVGDLIKDK